MIRTVTMTLVLIWASAATSSAQQKMAEPIRVADQLTLQAPEAWVRKEPKAKIVEHEFAITAAAGDETPGRVIMMSAGGSVQANMDRWVGQFTQAAGAAADTRQKEVAGHTDSYHRPERHLQRSAAGPDGTGGGETRLPHVRGHHCHSR